MPVQIGSFLVIPLWCETGTEMVSSNSPTTMATPDRIDVFYDNKMMVATDKAQGRRLAIRLI
jgi:hypothetical protein